MISGWPIFSVKIMNERHIHRLTITGVITMRFMLPLVICMSCGFHLQFSYECRAETTFVKPRLSNAISAIGDDDLKRHVDILADDTFEGRGAGTRGGRAAAGYLREQLISMGLKPAGNKGQYSQPFRNDCQNLLAVVPGSDSQLRDEYILIGAHYDHVGYGSKRNSYGPTGYIHNGADDNASGTSALLEIAEALTINPCRRNIIIAFWDGEEQGLWGSKHFITKPTIPIDQIKLAVNMDMVGRLRNNELTIYGTRTWNGARSVIASVNSAPINHQPFKIVFDWEIKANSDHHPFYNNRIPYLMPHTGLHDDYHRPRDDAHKINAQGIESVAKFTYRMLLEIDTQDSIPSFRDSAKRESPRTKKRFEVPLPPTPKRLGVAWKPATSMTNGLLITSVARRSPAMQAGIKSGDVILAFNGITVDNDEAMRNAVFSAPVISQITILSRGGEAAEIKDITLRGQPMRIGISWRNDAAEPSTSMISRVVPGSPADVAGLKFADRIHAVNGIPWSDTAAESHPLNNIALPFTIDYERNGRIYSTKLIAPHNRRLLDLSGIDRDK
jgi:hypothetical protein